MIISCHQNAGQNHNLLIAKKFFENSEVQVCGDDSKK